MKFTLIFLLSLECKYDLQVCVFVCLCFFVCLLVCLLVCLCVSVPVSVCLCISVCLYASASVYFMLTCFYLFDSIPCS